MTSEPPRDRDCVGLHAAWYVYAGNALSGFAIAADLAIR